MVLLGRVKEVGEFQLLVSLPCHLVGAVPVTSISSTYSKLIGSQQEDEVSSLRYDPDVYSKHLSFKVLLRMVD